MKDKVYTSIVSINLVKKKKAVLYTMTYTVNIVFVYVR
jgi:hypothetical protein